MWSGKPLWPWLTILAILAGVMVVGFVVAWVALHIILGILDSFRDIFRE